MGLSELILYAVPTGPLGGAIDRFFTEVADHPTTAQRYPPHCSLTGFFHDDADTIPRYVRATAEASARPVAVDIAALRTEPTWVGLEVRSPDLQTVASNFVELAVSVSTRVDEIRLKDWLHVSLAYGHPAADHAALADLATKIVDPAAEARWDLRLYERTQTSWIVHGSWPLVER